MADFNRKKLQVFVSSTHSDLIDERQAAVEAILAAGHIPAGMELFTAGDESQMEVIKQWIDESDVYLLILGGRYGSIEPKTEKSYTHLEYEYALAQGKPVFACVIKEEAVEPRVTKGGTKVVEMENPQKLKDFRALVLSKLSEFWEDTKDIKITITGKLSQLIRREDLVGWVRPSTQSENPAALADEMARLSKENADLRQQVGNSQEERINGVTFMEFKAILEKLNLLNFLIDNRKRLVDGIERTEQVVELMGRGLIEHKGGGWYVLSDGGRAFLNKYDVDVSKILMDSKPTQET